MIKLKKLKEEFPFNGSSDEYESNVSDSVLELLNKQIVHEIRNMMIYKKIASKCNDLNLNGFTSYFGKAGNEEFSHANKVISLLEDIYNSYDFPCSISVKMDTELMTLEDLVQFAYEVELSTTKALTYLKKVCEQSSTEGHVYSFLVGFLQEQIEEEAKLKILSDELSIAQGNPAAILFLDAEYGKK